MNSYAAYYNNEIRKVSSSGGLFSAFAETVDIVYGVSMTEDCYGAEVLRTHKDISSLRGSKYLQARTGDAYKQVKYDLEDGQRVLFSGTGCQINGLKSFLGTDYDNLVCLDIVCHGVPSPALWEKYAKFQESKYGKIKAINFRCKEYLVKDKGTEKNQLYISKDEDSYMKMFLRNYCLRPSCYECRFKEMKTSDITVADFWGIENVVPQMDDGKGISLVITRTDKGKILFNNVCKKINWEEVSYEDGVRNNPCEYTSVSRPNQRDLFFVDMNSMSFEKLAKKYVDPSIQHRVKCVLKNHFIKKGFTDMNRSIFEYGLLYTFEE